jgi:hypothetical protein
LPMPKGAKGFNPGPNARRFLWSIGDEDDGRRGAYSIADNQRKELGIIASENSRTLVD